MNTLVNFYSEKVGEIKKFLELYYSKNITLSDDLFWTKDFKNPIDMIDIMSCFIDNNDKFSINLWISLDTDIYICINENNINKIIKYMYERYPY